MSDHVLDHARDQAAYELRHAARGLDVRVLRGDLSKRFIDKWDLSNLFQAKQFGAQSIIDIVRIIRDVVRNSTDLAFRAGVAPQFKIVQFRIFGDGARNATFCIAGDRPDRR